MQLFKASCVGLVLGTMLTVGSTQSPPQPAPTGRAQASITSVPTADKLQSLTIASNVAQVIQSLVAVCLLIPLLFVTKELRESIAARHLEGMKYVREILLTQEAVELRKWVHRDLLNERRPLSGDAIEKVRRIGRDFDHIGLLCRKRLLPADIIATTYNRNITAMWNELQQTINDLRIKDKDRDYFKEFEWLANLASEKEAALQAGSLKW